MALIPLLFAAVLAGNALALNEIPIEDITNNEIRDEIVPGNVIFDQKSLYYVDNTTEVPVTANVDAPNDASKIDEKNDVSEPEAEITTTPAPNGSDNSAITETKSAEGEQNEQLVEFTNILTTKLKQIASDFETLVDNDKKLVDLGKLTPQAEEKIEDELLSEINTVMGLIPKEILEVMKNEEEIPLDIEVTITYDDTPSIGAGEHIRKVMETNATAFNECNKAMIQDNTVKCQKIFGPVCRLHPSNLPKAQTVHKCNVMSVPLMQATYHPRFYAVPATTPRGTPFQQIYPMTTPLSHAPMMHTISQTTQPTGPQSVSRSHTSIESQNVLTGDAVVTEENREESETLHGQMAVHSVHSELMERLVPAQHRFAVTPVQQYFVQRAV